MKFKQFLMLSSMALLSTSAFAESFEVDGLYYETLVNTDSIVRVVKPPYGEYTGAVEFVPTVTYEGRQYSVDQVASSQVFSFSTITNFTLGEGWFADGKYPTAQAWLAYDYDLEKLTFKSFYNTRDGGSWIVTGNGEKCVYVNVRRNSEDDTEVEIVNFNVYGPDGKKLEPFLTLEDNDFYAGNPTKIYPDKDGVFHLGKNFYTKDGQYCHVLPLAGSEYMVVILYVEYEGKYMAVRTQPYDYQTGRYVQVDGLTLAFQTDHFGVMPPKYNQERYSGDVVIPAEAEYEGKSYPVKVLTNSAFFGCPELTSLSIPSSVDSLCSYAVASCASLTDVYVYSKTPPRCYSGAFGYTEKVGMTLHIPYGSAAKYRNDSEWRRFAVMKEDAILDDYIFEVDGLRYEIIDDNPESLTVRVIKPVEGEYTGTVEFVPTVTYEGREYYVDPATSSQMFGYSTITDFTLGEGWFSGGKFQNARPALTYDYDLEKVTIKSFYNTHDGMSWIITGNGEKCVYVNVRRNSEDDTEVEIVNFNVYGPDGKKLEPILMLEDNDFYTGNPTKIYPDKDGVFRLGKNFYTKDGQYCQVLPLAGSEYMVVILYVEYEGKYMAIRTQPYAYQTGCYTEVNGIKLAFEDDHLVVMSPQHGDDLYTGDIVIPSHAEYEGRTYPVTKIGNYAFDACRDVTSITIPETVDSLCCYVANTDGGLTNIYSKSPTPPVCSELAFAPYEATFNVTLHVPVGAKDAYSAAPEWSKFVSIVDDINKEGIVLSHSEINIAADEVFQLGYALAEGKVKWSTSDGNVAYANECGLVVAMGITGTATITATADGVSANCVVNVTSLSQATRIRARSDGEASVIEPINVIIESIGGNPPMVNARLIPVGSSTVMTWTSSDESVMTVENGLVTIVGTGEATVEVETDNGLTQNTTTTSEEVKTSGVEDIIIDQPTQTADNNVYDLSGRCVLRNADSEALPRLRSGSYIYRGRKLVVK